MEVGSLVSKDPQNSSSVKIFTSPRQVETTCLNARQSSQYWCINWGSLQSTLHCLAVWLAAHGETLITTLATRPLRSLRICNTYTQSTDKYLILVLCVSTSETLNNCYVCSVQAAGQHRKCYPKLIVTLSMILTLSCKTNWWPPSASRCCLSARTRSAPRTLPAGSRVNTDFI